MQETKVTAPAAEAMEEDDEEEEGYVKAGTRFYRVTMRPSVVGGNAIVACRRRRLHYLDSCYLCKQSIACDRNVFMYRYVLAIGRLSSFFLPAAPPSLLFRSINTYTQPMAHASMEPWRAVLRCFGPLVLVW